VFEQAHSIKVKLEDCHLCGTQDCLIRLPSVVRTVKLKPTGQKPGHEIKKHIEEAKRDMEKEKREMSEDWTP
jgi:hypothetical protein